MEWTGARYADGPTVEVRRHVAAPPGTVWELVSDITLMPRLSGELQAVRWLDGATGPALGATFVGRNAHPSLGSWEATSYVVEHEPPRVFGWAVGDPREPGASWRFTVEPLDGEGTLLSQWVRLGPGRSGLSIAIDRMPDKEQKIVFVRLREFEAAMTRTVEAITSLAESR